MYDKINGSFCKYPNPPKGSKCNGCRMWDEINILLKSDGNITDVKAAFNINTLTELHMHLAASICFGILHKVVQSATILKLSECMMVYQIHIETDIG